MKAQIPQVVKHFEDGGWGEEAKLFKNRADSLRFKAVSIHAATKTAEFPFLTPLVRLCTQALLTV